LLAWISRSHRKWEPQTRYIWSMMWLRIPYGRAAHSAWYLFHYEGRFHSIFAIIYSDHRHWLHRLYRSYCVCEYCRNIVEISRGRPCDRILGPATLIIFNPISYIFAYADYDVFERLRLRSLIRWMWCK